ncbi:hypothetical protein AB0O75_12930 [Streptomyces sp. NPDC088921]|uniref:hypothetical protein n=1 Tax=unclassified Streptomyces TaxID=2593676 RepID=UPI003436B795
MFEHRTEAEMRLYSEKMARELALKRRQNESDVEKDTTENDDVVDTPSLVGETPATTGTTVTTDPE